MEKLIELSQIVTKNRLKKIDMLSPKGTKGGNKYLNVSDSLAKGYIASAEEIAKIIGADVKSNNFHVFKMRLFDKLLNSLLFLDLDERKFHPYGIAISECNRNSYCVRVLLLLNARHSAAFIASKTLKKALKFELADVVLFCARHLRTHFSLLGDKKNFEYYNSLVKNYHIVLAAEDEAAEYFEAINENEANSNTPQKEHVSIAHDSLPKVASIFKKYPTYQISLNYYRIKGITFFLQRNYTAAIKTWHEFDALIEKYKHFEYYVRIAESELHKMDCYLHMHDFKEGSKCALNCDKLFKEYSNNWYIFKEYYLLLAFQTGNYIQASKTIDIVVRSNHFNQLNVNRKEIWRIFEAYLYILWKSGKAKGVGIKERAAQFRLNKFLNSTPIYSKDKKGYNVSILIIQILALFLERKYHDITSKIDALEQYAYRYFKQDKDSRAYTFLKMIVEVERARFILEQTQRRTEVLYSKLETQQFAYISGLEGLEIVPFTDLWKIVLECIS